MGSLFQTIPSGSRSDRLQACFKFPSGTGTPVVLPFQTLPNSRFNKIPKPNKSKNNRVIYLYVYIYIKKTLNKVEPGSLRYACYLLGVVEIP